VNAPELVAVVLGRDGSGVRGEATSFVAKLLELKVGWVELAELGEV
jgi:hypothetical protein